MAVEGAAPGRELVVSILEIATDGWAWTANIPGFGLLSDDFPQPHLWISTVSGGTVSTPVGVDVPARPMIGTIGVAPAARGPAPLLVPTEAGGNMDIAQHAVQGDGEVCGTGAETSSTVRLRVEVVPQARSTAPWYEHSSLPSETAWTATTGIGPDLFAAARDATRRAVELVAKGTGLDPIDAYLLISLTGAARVGGRGRPELGHEHARPRPLHALGVGAKGRTHYARRVQKFTFAVADPANPGGQAPFVPERLDPRSVVGQVVQEWTGQAGTYGMGGPGFLGFRTASGWLVIAVWGAAAWFRLDGRLLEDLFWDKRSRDRPWMDDPEIDPDGLFRGKRIVDCSVERDSIGLRFEGGAALELSADPGDRPCYEGDGAARAVEADDDLRTAVFWAPTTELWI